MSLIPKPELRRLLHNQIKKNLVVSIVLGIVGGIAYKFLICDVRRQAYLDYHKTYDIEKEFHIMRNKGLFDSCAPDS